jgi:excisionase family DNA binding protein
MSLEDRFPFAGLVIPLMDMRSRGASMSGHPARLVYTVGEAAALLGVGRSTAYDLIARGELRAVRLGRRLCVTRPVLTELLGCEPPLPQDLDVDDRPSRHRLRSVPPIKSV